MSNSDSAKIRNPTKTNRPLTIFIKDDPGLTRDLWRAFAGHPSVEAIYNATLPGGVQRVDVWRRAL